MSFPEFHSFLRAFFAAVVVPCALFSQAAFAAASPLGCPAGAPVADMDLRVESSRGVGEPLPLRTINRLDEGDIVTYRPIVTKVTKEQGSVALVLVPAIRHEGEDPLVVLEPKPADKPQQWTIPSKTSIVSFVYGPGGLSRSKVKHFLLKGDDLVAQIADYAEQTSETEALLKALSNTESSSANVDAAVQGFASKWGISGKFDPHAAVDQQASALFANLNPAMGSLDPIATQTSQRIAGAAGLATSVATLFLGSPVGLIAGGAVLAIQMKQIAFPKAEFRSSFVQPLPGDGMALCGNRGPAPPHTQVAFLWATRISNSRAPVIRIGDASTLALGQKSPISVDANETDWKLIDRARKWALVSADGKTSVPVSVSKALVGKTLELDLTQTDVPTGEFDLTAYWDWDQFSLHGEVGARPLGDFKTARLRPESQDQLIARAGKVPVTVEGSDFEFVNKVELEKIDDRFNAAVPVPFVLPRGIRQGLQPRMDVQVNTIDLDPGDYRLLIAQVDGKAQPVDVKVLALPPRIDGLPLLVNVGDTNKPLALRGEHLDSVTKLEATKGSVELGPGTSSERRITLRMPADLEPGTRVGLKVYVKDMAQPLELREAIKVVGPRPRILESKVSTPEGMEVSLHPGELPSGYFLSTMLRVKNVEPGGSVKLGCTAGTSNEVTVRIGEQLSGASLQQLAPDQLFLSFDSSAWPSGCIVTARVDGGSDGQSEPFQLGRIVRVPKIENFRLTSEEVAPGLYIGVLTGQNLETIERTGWEAAHSNSVLGLPTPLPGEGQKQSLKIKMPWPSPAPHAPLFIWLRGTKQALATTVHD
ncbi:MAG: hypothetical protein WBW33_30325 [Bryobacteraceae bacterium]